MNPADANIYKGLKAQSEPNPIKGTAARLARNKLKLMMIARDKKRKPPGKAKPAQPKPEAKPAQPKPGQGQGKTKTTVTRDGKRTTTTTVTPKTDISAMIVDEKREGNVFIVTVEATGGKLKGKRAQGRGKGQMLGRQAAAAAARANLAAGKFIN